MKWLLSLCLCGLAGVAFAGEGARPVAAFLEMFERADGVNVALGTLSKEWVVEGGALRTSGQAGSMPGFALGDDTWADMDIEFRVQIRREKEGDHHFGLILRKSEAGGLQFYCRRDQAYLLETGAKSTLRHAALGHFRAPIVVSEDAAFHRFRVLCRGSQARVWMDGCLVGEAEDLVPVAGSVRFYAYNLDVALDDLCVTLYRTARAGEAAAPSSPNVVPNSSFECTTEPGLADYWGCPHWGITDTYWVPRFEEWTRHFGVDDRVAFEGRRSMRIVNPEEKPAGSGLQLRSCMVGARQKVPYVLSAHLKSDPPGVRVKFGGIYRQREFTLTGGWQRLSLPFLNEKGLYEDTVNLCVQSKGTVWIDAVQLEEGQAPTPYTPSAIDGRLVDASPAPAAAPPETPIVALPAAGAPPKLDGRLDDACWRTAARVALKGLWGGEPSEPTLVRLCRTPEGIALAIECTEKGAASNACRTTEHDGPVWGDPSIEILLSPRGDDRAYHLALNRAGVLYDAAGDDASWRAPWKAATRTGEGAWTAEVFLPFGAFAAEAQGNTLWGLNVGRNNPGIGERSAWSPTQGSLHRPDRFGHVRLDAVALKPYRLGIRDVRLLPDGDKAILECRLRNGTAQGGSYALDVTVTSGGRTLQRRQVISLGATASEVVSLPLAGLGEAVEVVCDLRLSDARTGALRGCTHGTLRAAAMAAPQVLPQFRTVTTERELRVRVRQEGARRVNAGKAAIEVVVEDAKTGRQVARSRCPASPDGADVSVAAGAWPNGEYRIRALSAAGEASATVSKVPAAAHEVKIDRFRRLLLADGKVLIPTAIDWEGELTPEILAYLRKHGINTVMANAYNLPAATAVDQLRTLLDQAQAAGVRLVIAISAGDADVEKARALIRAFPDHPALLAWDIFDEIFTVPWGKEHYDTVAARCRELRGLSPYRPVYLNENAAGMSYLEGKGLDFPGEIVSIDHYAYPPAGDIPVTMRYVRTLEQMGRAEGKPVFLFVLGAGYAFGASRDHTPAEHDTLAYGSLIEGVRGLFYFASHPKSRTSWQRIQGICREVAELSPVLAAPGDPEEVACSAPTVSVLAKRVGGKLTLIAANSARTPVTARLDLAALVGKAAPKAEVLFESRRMPLKDGCIEDRFAGFGRHVYTVALPKPTH